MRQPPAGIDVYHSTTLDARDVTAVAGIPVTTVARTLVDLANVVRRDSLAKALREAEHLRAVDVRDLRAALERTRHRPGPGHAELKAVLEEHRRRGTQLTRSLGAPKDRVAFQRDREKGNALTGAGWQLLRFTHDDVVRRPEEIAAQLRRLLAGA